MDNLELKFLNMEKTEALEALKEELDKIEFFFTADHLDEEALSEAYLATKKYYENLCKDDNLISILITRKTANHGGKLYKYWCDFLDNVKNVFNKKIDYYHDLYQALEEWEE